MDCEGVSPCYIPLSLQANHVYADKLKERVCRTCSVNANPFMRARLLLCKVCLENLTHFGSVR